MKIGIIGLGYVGLPLCLQFSKSGAYVLGFDLDLKKVESLNRGESYINHIDSWNYKLSAMKAAWKPPPIGHE